MSCFHLLNKNITSKVSKKTYFIVELLTKMSIHDQRKQYWIWFNQFWLESIKLSPYNTHRERLHHCLTFLLNLQPDPLGSMIWIKLSMLNRIYAMFLFSFSYSQMDIYVCQCCGWHHECKNNVQNKYTYVDILWKKN